MRSRFVIVLLTAVAAALLFSAAAAQSLESPNGDFELKFQLTEAGEPEYRLLFRGAEVVKPSRLGFMLKSNIDLSKGLRIVSTQTAERDSTWEPVWGEVSRIRDHHKELAVTLRQKEGSFPKEFVIRFRLFDDGLGFRYEFPVQDHLQYFEVLDERTEFALTGDHNAFWIPGDFDTNEYAYSETKLSGINAKEVSAASISISTRSNFSDDAVQTPLMLKGDGLYISIHEAALVNYSAMALLVDKRKFVLKSELAPNTVGSKAHLQTPSHTPWRTVIASDDARKILASKTILNLNEPSKINETSWIKPQKFAGIWWAMHVGTAAWNYADVRNVKLGMTDWKSLTPNGRHGATTENTKRHIDFAANNGIDSVLVEGWNVGWEDWFGNWKDHVFDFLTPYPDFDVEEVNRYAASKGVKLMMHHETSASVTNYERYLERAFAFMNKHGYEAVKTGYVGRIIPRGELHDGQYMVNHYTHVAERAADYRIMVNSHESVRPTGLHRTYPNWMTAEAARGNEFNAWSKGNPPAHETILPFTRLMGGPMDYTPGIFQTKMSAYDPAKKELVHTTLVKQLALYVTMYSPLQMVADLPENYEKFPDAFRFIRDVGVDWEDTVILAAEPGDYVVIARKEKGTGKWFLGAVTDENPRSLTLPLGFLDGSREFSARFYEDGPDAHWEKNPQSYRISERKQKRGDVIELRLAPGGGAAVSFE